MIRTGIKSFDSFSYPILNNYSKILKLNVSPHVNLLRPIAGISHFRCTNSKQSWSATEINHISGSSLKLNFVYGPEIVPCREIHTTTTGKTSPLLHVNLLTTRMNENTMNSFHDRRCFSNDVKPEENIDTEKLDRKDKKGRFKALIRDYGVTAVVFHVTISLASLGVCWLLVNSSLPMEDIFVWLGIHQKLGSLTEAASTSTNFVVAYALHKSFALVRLSITAACVPILVRFLRSKGIIKPVANVIKK